MIETTAILLLAVLLALTLAFGFAFFRLFRWKVSFEGKEIIAVPSERLTELNDGLAKLAKSVSKLDQNVALQSADMNTGYAKVFERVQALLKAVSETRAEYRTLRDDIERKAIEIERFREGYDSKIAARCLDPIVSMDVVANHALAREELSDDLRKFLDLLLDHHAEAFEHFEIRTVSPEINAPPADFSIIKTPPRTTPTDIDSKVGCICDVHSPAYVMQGASGIFLLRKAEVTIYSETSSEGVDNG